MTQLITKYNDVCQQIAKYWDEIKELADKRDDSQIHRLRLAVTLLNQYYVRKLMYEGEMKDGNLSNLQR